MGRECVEIVKTFNKDKKNEKIVKVKLFLWEKLNAIDAMKKALKMK
jgi:hypothetical protein